MTHYRGVVRGGAVILETAADLPEGTEVQVIPLQRPAGSPRAILEGVLAAPDVDPELVDELDRLIEQGRLPVNRTSPLDRADAGEP